MPLNSAKLPSPCRKKRSIGIMRSIAFNSAGGGAMLRAAKVCRSGNRSINSSISAPGLREICPPSGRIWRCNSSDSLRVGGADVARLVGEAERGVAQRDQHLQPRHAVGNIEHRIAQVADLARQSAQIAAVELAVGVAEHQRRLRQQRDDAARQHVGAAADRRACAPDSKSSRRPASGRWRGSARYRPRADAAASRNRAAPTSQSSDGGSRSKIERPWQVTILPANTKRPA